LCVCVKEICVYVYLERERQTDRQIDRQTERKRVAETKNVTERVYVSVCVWFR
jgi:hypothetical protein